MKKYFFIMVLLALPILLFGCGPTNNVGTKGTPFLGGTDGLVITFVENYPPAEVYDGGDFPFDVQLMIDNVGEYTVPQDKLEVRLKGLRPEEFSKTAVDFTKHPEEELVEAYKDPEGNRIAGTTAFIDIKDLNRKGKLLGNTQYPIRAEICYTYKTKAQSMACIRKDLLSNKGGVCVVSEAKNVFSSGAPIKVSTFKESVSGKDKITFTFDIEKQAKGDVYKRGTNCQALFANENRVFFEITSDIVGLKCSNLRDGTATSGYILLDTTGKASVNCIQTISTETVDSATPIYISLEYDYLDFVEKTILVKHTI